jgi:hypothetical protein
MTTQQDEEKTVGRSIAEYQQLAQLLSYNSETGELFWNQGTRYYKGVAGGKRPDGYWYITHKGKKFCAHRVAWFIQYGWLPDQIDHINMDRSNNKIANLRAATNTENAANRSLQTNNTTGFKGVSFYKANGKFQAKITSGNKLKHLGYFEKAEEAARAYEIAARKNHGEFART